MPLPAPGSVTELPAGFDAAVFGYDTPDEVTCVDVAAEIVRFHSALVDKVPNPLAIQLAYEYGRSLIQGLAHPPFFVALKEQA